MKRADAFPSKYLGKDDLKQPVRATIVDVRLETIKGDHGEEDKAIMYFDGEDFKPMILNTTNWNTCEDTYGEDSTDWRDKPVELYVDPGVMYAGKRVGGVRLRVPSGEAATPSATWTLEEAKEKAAAVGITPDALIEALKARGQTAYNPARDTATIRQMIEDAESDIPF